MPDLTYTAPGREGVAALLPRSNRLGSEPRNTNYAGGNASAKGTATDDRLQFAEQASGADGATGAAEGDQRAKPARIPRTAQGRAIF
jgi:rhamnose utilization protein RhaD (predicted bifunctional aldolase and dehydrogenase)